MHETAPRGDGVLRMIVQEGHGRQEKRDDAAIVQVPEGLPDERPSVLLARHGNTLRLAPPDGGTVFPVRSATARPGWIADDDIGLHVMGVLLEEVLVTKDFFPRVPEGFGHASSGVGGPAG